MTGPELDATRAAQGLPAIDCDPPRPLSDQECRDQRESGSFRGINLLKFEPVIGRGWLFFRRRT